MGGSGCGKTTLAKTLRTFDNKKFNNIIEYSTRNKRENEVNGIDYNFISKEDFFNKHLNNSFCEEVNYQFSPGYYGALLSDIDDKKWNIIVVSVEGFISMMNHVNTEDSIILINIINDIPTDINRTGRDNTAEENVNLGVISALANGKQDLTENSTSFSMLNNKNRIVNCTYIPLKLSGLKKIRNDKEQLLLYFNSICK